MPITTQASSDPKISNLKTRFNKAAELVMEKVAGHLTDPAKYPLPADPQSLEKATHAVLMALSNRRREKFIDQYKGRLSASATTRKQWYGDLAGIGLKSSAPVTELLKTVAVPQHLQFNKTDLDKFSGKVSQSNGKKTAPKIKAAGPAAPVAGSKLVFIVDSLTCNKTSEIRKDEISMGAFVIDALGAIQSKEPFFVGEFKKDDSVALGDAGQLFSFEFDSVGIPFPQAFSAGLFLVEKDLMDNVELSDKLQRFFIVLVGFLGAVMLAGAAMGILGVPIQVVAPILLIATGVTVLSMVLAKIFAFIATDFSSQFNDTLVLDVAPVSGLVVNRTASFELYNGDVGLLDGAPGRYSAAIRWVIE